MAKVAGGGATRDDLKVKFHEKDRIFNILFYIVTTCSLYALHLTLSLPKILTMDGGGLKKRTALQLLYTAYNLTQ